MTTYSSQDYLEAILTLSNYNIAVSIKSIDVANYLKVSRPGVNKAMNLLLNEGLIHKEKYGGITLTQVGYDIALEVCKKHQLLECFLKDILKVSDENAQQDACKMEHVISEETYLKLIEFVKEYR